MTGVPSSTYSEEPVPFDIRLIPAAAASWSITATGILAGPSAAVKATVVTCAIVVLGAVVLQRISKGRADTARHVWSGAAAVIVVALCFGGAIWLQMRSVAEHPVAAAAQNRAWITAVVDIEEDPRRLPAPGPPMVMLQAEMTRVDVGGEAGKDYTKFIGSSFKDDGVSWGNWIKSILPDGGNVLFLSGPAGNSQGLDELAGMKTVLDDKYVFINPEPFDVTNWDPSLTQQVLSAEIAKNEKIDVIVSDFGPSLVGALPVFKKFNRSIPAIATSDGNSLGCFWTDNVKDNPDFKLFTVATGNDNVRLAVQWAVAAATGGTPPTDEIFKAPVFEDSVSGKPSAVQCRADLPGSIYLSATMPGDDQAKAVNK